MKRSISKPIIKGKGKSVLSPEMRDFLADFHNFTNKWPSHKIAKIPEIDVTRQNIYNLANYRKEKNESSS